MIETISLTGSTNSDLAYRLRAGDRVSEGHWLVAERQESGRGRQGRDWFDGSGNFMGSTVVHPGASDPPSQTLALLAGLALYEACVGYCSDPTSLSLKWPNDLLVGRAKAAGILLEGQSGAVIVGIGVNLAAAPNLQERETIAFSQFGPKPDRDDFAVRLAYHFDNELERWRTYGLEPMIRRWLGVAHPEGTKLSVHDNEGAILHGQFDGLAEDGSLILRLADGTTRAIHAGDVMLT